MLVIILGTYMFQGAMVIFIDNLVGRERLAEDMWPLSGHSKNNGISFAERKGTVRAFQVNTLKNMSVCLEVRDDLPD